MLTRPVWSKYRYKMEEALYFAWMGERLQQSQERRAEQE
jgi:hypothetical protein